VNWTRSARAVLAFALLVLLHYTVRPLLGWRTPVDFLVIAVLLSAVRVRPGAAALIGFLTGLVADSLTPSAFGAGALAMTAVGATASWLKAVFFADNVVLHGFFFFVGKWAYDIVYVTAERRMHGVELATQLLLWSPLSAALTALPESSASHVAAGARAAGCMSFHPNEVQRRGRTATFILTGAFVFLASAFFRTQILEHAAYNLQSETNRLREVPLPAPRGIIYDRHGAVIAENLPGTRFPFSRRRPTRSASRCADCQGVISLTPEQIEAAVRRFRQAPNRPTVVLADASFDVVSVLEERRVDFPGLIIQAAPKRLLP
jgi:rod shape-determining protein MreD